MPTQMPNAPATTTDQRIGREDPARNMTAEQQEADHERIWLEYQARFGAWLPVAAAAIQDLRSLDRVELLDLAEPPRESLSAAVADADLIVIARAISIEFLPDQTTQVHLSVEQSLKGVRASDLSIVLPGGLQPAGPDWAEAVLAESEATPLILPGDYGIFLLQKVGDRYEVQSHTGEMRLDEDTVSVLRTHPAHDSIDGLPLDEVADLLRALGR
jgi:hypothetical protein